MIRLIGLLIGLRVEVGFKLEYLLFRDSVQG